MSRNPDNKNIKPWMFRETAKKIASRDPGLAASWLESNLGNKSVNGEVVGQVASSWVEKDPEAAANWVSRPEGNAGLRQGVDQETWGRMGKKRSGGRIGVGSNARPEALECHLGEHHRKPKQGRACPQCSVDQGKLYGRAP